MRLTSAVLLLLINIQKIERFQFSDNNLSIDLYCKIINSSANYFSFYHFCEILSLVNAGKWYLEPHLTLII